ncbi:hypothetical protein [Xylanibacter rarus]|uniref:hypothetical protein n=1 Tax=Xylanibacter rarus TaxID=1676614 RepID=UPI003FEE0841
MKKTFIIMFFALFAMTTTAQTYSNMLNKVRIRIINNEAVKKSPYHGESITSYYNSCGKTLAVWFHYRTAGATVMLIKDGEELSSDVFDLAADEVLEYDLSECDAGEYSVYVQTENDIYLVGNFVI